MTIKLFNIDWRILNNVINSFILDAAGVVGPLLGKVHLFGVPLCKQLLGEDLIWPKFARFCQIFSKSNFFPINVHLVTSHFYVV